MQLPQIRLFPSLCLAGFFIFIHLGAMLCILAVPIVWAMKIAILCIAAYNLGYCLNRHVLRRHPAAIVKLWPGEQGTWILQTKNGKVHIASLRGDSVITAAFVLLNFQQTRRRFLLLKNHLTVMLCADGVEAEAFRCLRVYLNVLRFSH